jgi:hypothetical protein
VDVLLILPLGFEMREGVAKVHQSRNVLVRPSPTSKRRVILEKKREVEFLKDWFPFEQFPELIYHLTAKFRKMLLAVDEDFICIRFNGSNAAENTSSSVPQDLFEKWPKLLTRVLSFDLAYTAREVSSCQHVLYREPGLGITLPLRRHWGYLWHVVTACGAQPVVEGEIVS